jgi:hypothetical protein
MNAGQRTRHWWTWLVIGPAVVAILWVAAGAMEPDPATEQAGWRAKERGR